MQASEAPTTDQLVPASGPSLDGPASTASRPLPVELLLRVRQYGIVGACLMLFITLSIASPVFFTQTNMLNLLEQTAPIGIVVCGGTLVMIAGGYDLSVGATYAFAGVIAAKVALAVDPVLGLMAGVLVGLGLGVVNALVVAAFKVNTFIGTLATGYMFRGVVTIITGGFLISVSDSTFKWVGQSEVIGVQTSIILFATTVAVTTILLNRTTFGRYVFAVGGNAEAARLAGIRVGLIRGATFAISGLCAGLAGVIAASRISTGQADAGTGLELAAIAAIVVGGTSIMGGSGAIWRSVLGVLLIAMIGNGFNLLSIDPFYETVAQGAIILIAVSMDAWSKRTA